MTDSARIVGIRKYPVKSLDPHSVRLATVGPSGSLVDDRRYALFDEHSQLVNGKREPRLHLVRSRYDDTVRRISLDGGPWWEFSRDRALVEEYVSAMLGYSVVLREDPSGGLLDDPAGSHLTVVSTATLELVASWFGWSDLEQARLRFRANIEVDGVPAFWEDRLFLPDKQPVSCVLGEVKAKGRKPCPRCPVPARNPFTGESDKGFQKRFNALRLEQLPSWSHLPTYPHAYFMATTIIVDGGQEGKAIHCDDRIVIQ